MVYDKQYQHAQSEDFITILERTLVFDPSSRREGPALVAYPHLLFALLGIPAERDILDNSDVIGMSLIGRLDEIDRLEQAGEFTSRQARKVHEIAETWTKRIAEAAVRDGRRAYEEDRQRRQQYSPAPTEVVPPIPARRQGGTTWIAHWATQVAGMSNPSSAHPRPWSSPLVATPSQVVDDSMMSEEQETGSYETATSEDLGAQPVARMITPGRPPPVPGSAVKPYRCPVQGCLKTYVSSSGLRYHKEHGTCVFADSGRRR